jgi:hypothetical protein
MGRCARRSVEPPHGLGHNWTTRWPPLARGLDDARHVRPATAGGRSNRALMPGKEQNEMTIGQTDDPENPFVAPACEAASVFGSGLRIPSGPAVMAPGRQGRTRDRNRPARQIFHLFSCIQGTVHTCNNAARRVARPEILPRVGMADMFASMPDSHSTRTPASPSIASWRAT